MVVSGSDRNKLIWEVVYYHVVEHPINNNVIGLWGGREISIELFSLLINFNETIALWLVESVEKYEDEVGRVQWESYGNEKIKYK